jgi:ribonuclease P protein component
MYSLPKSEILRGKTSIDKLFGHGQRMSEYPFRVIYQINPSAVGIPALRFGIVVPKRVSKLAHERNRIKRLAREAYRLNKHLYSAALEERGKQVDFFLVYTGKIKPVSAKIHDKIILILQRLTQDHDATAE